jgi:hypothetical protein
MSFGLPPFGGIGAAILNQNPIFEVSSTHRPQPIRLPAESVISGRESIKLPCLIYSASLSRSIPLDFPLSTGRRIYPPKLLFQSSDHGSHKCRKIIRRAAGNQIAILYNFLINPFRSGMNKVILNGKK